MIIGSVAYCDCCGQPLRPDLAWCICGHLELSHDLNTKGVRTRCYHIAGPKGVRCPCTRFTLPD